MHVPSSYFWVKLNWKIHKNELQDCFIHECLKSVLWLNNSNLIYLNVIY